MEKKFCNTCSQEKSIEDFSIRNVETGSRQSNCKECKNKMSKRHYNSNKQVYIEKNKKRLTRLRDEISTYKATHGCARCGNSNPIVLDLHHPDKNKEFAVSQGLNSRTIDEIFNELAKCEVLCRNCHAIVHHELRNKTK